MIITRSWAMPNSNTFEIAPIREIIDRHLSGRSVDPFANRNKLATVTNDLSADYDTDYNMDALKFMRLMVADSFDTVLFDPPYSPRQVSECYKANSLSVNMETTQASFWSNLKKEVKRITRTGGYVITCGWNSGGIGEKYGFRIVEILIVAHGGWHNDTIVTVEKKVDSQLELGGLTPAETKERP